MLKPGTRVSLDMTALTIMRILPHEADPRIQDEFRRPRSRIVCWHRVFKRAGSGTL